MICGIVANLLTVTYTLFQDRYLFVRACARISNTKGKKNMKFIVGLGNIEQQNSYSHFGII